MNQITAYVFGCVLEISGYKFQRGPFFEGIFLFSSLFNVVRFPYP